MAAFFRWWYGAGWKLVLEQLGLRLRSVAGAFSVKLLVRTLFSPWRRVVAVRRRGLDGAFHAAIDNAVGRFIGFSVRCIVLVAAAITIVILSMLGGVVLVLWPLLPPAAILLVVVGVMR